MGQTYAIKFYFRRLTEIEQTIRQGVDLFLHHGCLYQTLPADSLDWPKELGFVDTLETKIEGIARAGHGHLKLWWERVDFLLSFDPAGIRRHPQLLTPTKYGTVEVTLDRDHLAGGEGDRVADWLREWGNRLYACLSPEFGWAGAEIEQEIPDRDLDMHKWRQVHWLNYLGPAYVQQLGEARLRAAPAWQVQDMDDGGLVIVTQRNPEDYRAQNTILAVARHFKGLEPWG